MVDDFVIDAAPSPSDRQQIPSPVSHGVWLHQDSSKIPRFVADGVEPAWALLEFNSLNALRQEPSDSNQAIRLEPNLANGEISGSAVTANALILLQQAADTGGLKLTATGNLSRAVVDEMCEMIKAPGYDK